MVSYIEEEEIQYEEDMEEEPIIEDETKKEAEGKSIDKCRKLSLKDAINKVIAERKERTKYL